MSCPPFWVLPSMAPSLTVQIMGLPIQPFRVAPSNSFVRPGGVPVTAGVAGALPGTIPLAPSELASGVAGSPPPPAPDGGGVGLTGPGGVAGPAEPPAPGPGAAGTSALAAS